MANILLGIEHGVEVAAEDLLKFVSGAAVAGNKAAPGVVAGLGVLLVACRREIVTTDAVRRVGVLPVDRLSIG
jgi:hypothetical protein